MWSHHFHLGCRLTSFSRPAPTLLPRGPACGLCNIQIGWFVWCGRGGGRGQTYCDPTISCFVRSTFWSEDQLEAAINRRKTCSGKRKNREEERRGEKKAADVMIWKHQCNIFYTKPFFWEESLLFLYNGVLTTSLEDYLKLCFKESSFLLCVRSRLQLE